jgi:hypothetical protein
VTTKNVLLNSFTGAQVSWQADQDYVLLEAICNKAAILTTDPTVAYSDIQGTDVATDKVIAFSVVTAGTLQRISSMQHPISAGQKLYLVGTAGQISMLLVLQLPALA